MRIHDRLRAYYQCGLARLRYVWDDLEETGDEYQDGAHPYSSDLDLFGRGSMFQLLCTARTGIGRRTLANWLKAPTSREQALARQSAVADLRDRPELREALALAGVLRVGECHWETFENWLTAPRVTYPRWAPFAAFLLAVCTLLVPLLAWAGILAHTIFIALLIACLTMEIPLAAVLYRRVQASFVPLPTLAIELPLIIAVLRILERNEFSSPRLAHLKNALGARRRAASAELNGTNVHFSDSVNGQSLHFDYKLRDGVLQQSNATAIVRLLGFFCAASEISL